MPSVGLKISLLLSCFVFTLSYGAGYYTMTDSNCSIYILNTGMGAVTYAMPGESPQAILIVCGVSWRYSDYPTPRILLIRDC